ncbi:MAG: twin-arginine translocation signal domain-containing protein [Betaproteobacteria bacterium]|nr:twin-arginine translocation signal domain-containing protein [Betaproteobacteria bacterium]
MSDPSRRQFLEMSGAAAAAIGMPLVDSAQASEQATSSTVFMDQEGLGLTASESAGELSRLCALREPKMDLYGLGGIVEEVEQYFARVLGKERALFMPTGTLANQLALRALAGDKRRVIVQDVSHVYNDTGDACQILSGQTLLPLAPDRATFTWEEVERTLNRTASGRVLALVGALSIESPVRRRSGELFDHAEMTRICAQAKQRGIGLHLDGARLFIASAYTGISPASYAAPFDTVYVSLWKYFNSLNGAILAGPASLLDGMYHTRRMFGGALFSAWPFALLARHYAEGFIERLSSAIAISNEFIAAIKGKSARIERVPNGTNIFKLIVAEYKVEALMEKLRARQIVLPKPARGSEGAVFNLYVNDTWNRTTGARLAEQFRRAL